MGQFLLWSTDGFKGRRGASDSLRGTAQRNMVLPDVWEMQNAATIVVALCCFLSYEYIPDSRYPWAVRCDAGESKDFFLGVRKFTLRKILESASAFKWPRRCTKRVNYA